MAHADFVHLRVHTAYSLSEGAIQIADLAKLCRSLEMPAVAVTDSGNLFGALEFCETLWEAGVQPIVGCCLPVTREDRHQGSEAGAGAREEPAALVLLVQNETGYQNLMKLSSKAFLETDGAEQPHVTFAELAELGAGLIVLSGGADGPVGRLLADGQYEAAEETLKALAAAFPGRLYVEIQRHKLPTETRVEESLIDLAFRFDLPLVATNNVLFAGEEMFEAHDVLTCVAASATVGQEDRPHFTPDHRFKSAQEMRVLFADLPEALDNTLVIARRCAYRVPLREPMLPTFSENEADQLRQDAEQGLTARLAVSPPRSPGPEAEKEYRDRLAYELGVIIEMGFPGYYLIVADFVQWAKREGIPVGPGRGSGAGSLVAWALTITDLDPLRFGLLFERFLNPERVSIPDFDIDFCQDRRDEVIHYVQEKYGFDHVAQIITIGTFQARAALRDVGRVLEMPYGQVDRLCKLVPNNPAKPVKLAEAVAREPKLRQARQEEEGVERLFDISERLEGLYRHASTHAAGVVIGDRPLHEMVPLYRDPRSPFPVTQFNMKWVEKAGLVKFDFLGLKTLTVLDLARKLVARRGVEISLENLPLDDPATYELLGRGDTVGVFQLESAGMRDLVRQLKPKSIEVIIALVALFRPGPMENIPKFVRCSRGEEDPDYLDPVLEPVLRETYGVVVYQEQVMEIARVMSGFSLGDADLLRRAMGKKIKKEMNDQRERFVSGAVANGHDQSKAANIFGLLSKFAEYGFNKSHAATYAVVAYQTAWMKANYPVEFMAATMTLDMGQTEKLGILRQELRRMEISVLPPDINRSEATFAVETEVDGETGERRGAIRYALAAIRNVGRQAMEDLVKERETNGPFSDLSDLARRLDPRAVNKRQIENLARAGAFDEFEPNRHKVVQGAETVLRHAALATEERETNQESLFGPDAGEMSAVRLPKVPPWLPLDQLREEVDAIGFYLSAHPLDSYGADKLLRLQVTPFAGLAARVEHGQGQAILAGTVLGVRERVSKRGDRFAFVQLSDQTGMYEIVAFPEVLAASRDLLAVGNSVLLTVDVAQEDEGLKLSAQSVRSLDDAMEQSGAGLRVYISEADVFDGLKTFLDGHGRGRGLIVLALTTNHGRREVEVTLPGRFAVSPPVREAIKAMPGVSAVHDL